jgi:hypothetical protein
VARPRFKEWQCVRQCDVDTENYPQALHRKVNEFGVVFHLGQVEKPGTWTQFKE